MRTIFICLALFGTCGALYSAASEPNAPASMQPQLGIPPQTSPHSPLPRRDDPILSEDFENGAEGWTTTDLTNLDTAWHRSNFNARNDDLLWWCGDSITGFDSLYIGYNNIWLQYLDTPVLDLSDAADNLSLFFAAYWLLEDPRRVPPPNPFDGWDGWLVMISTNAGDDFEVLTPEAPRYSAARLSAAERFWGIGQMPGWVFHSGEWEAPQDTTPEPDWVNCSFNLDDYAQENVVIRFLVVTDRTVAAPWNYYLRNSGVFLDDILIVDGEGAEFLSNNADDDPAPAELIPRRGPGFGDHWELTDQDQHSGEFSMWNDDDHFNVVNVLDSPPVQIPQGANTYFQFWVHCDLPDGVHQGDNVLKDFYQIYLTNDQGRTWTYITHDYNRPEAGGEDWVHYIPGLPFAGNLDLDLTDYAGQTVQLRWMFRTDNDHTAGNGSGLFLDDIEIISANQFVRDAGMVNFILPYPQTVGYRRTNITVEMHNFGIRDLQSVRAAWGWRAGAAGREYPIMSQSVAANDSVIIPITDYTNAQIRGWTPTEAGVFTAYTLTLLGVNTPGDPEDDDLNTANDSVGYAGVEVFPANMYSLGYDFRQAVNGFNFERGEGPAVRFSPQDIGLNDYTIGAVSFRFLSGQEGDAAARLHICRANQDDLPGQDRLAIDFIVPARQTNPRNFLLPLNTYEELRELSGDFWVWLELTRDDGRPAIMGDQHEKNINRYYRFSGNDTQPLSLDLLIHPLITPRNDVSVDLAASAANIDFGEVIVDRQRTRSVSLFASGLLPVTVTNVTSDNAHFIVNWEGEAELAFGQSIAFNVTFRPDDESDQEGHLTIETTDEEPPVVTLFGYGTLSAPQTEIQPERFGLESIYPNPFNQQARLAFTLDRPSQAKIILFDISGREVKALAEGKFTAGRHALTVDAAGLPVGIYLVKLETETGVAIQKALLVK